MIFGLEMLRRTTLVWLPILLTLIGIKKRIIGLRLIDVSQSGENIAKRMLAVLEEYVLTDKVFAVTLDNASTNSNAMERLSSRLSAYVGELFSHQRCAYHIINLIVKSGLKRLKPYLAAFRTAISFLNSYNQLCIQ